MKDTNIVLKSISNLSNQIIMPIKSARTKISMETLTRWFLRSLNTNLESEFQNSK